MVITPFITYILTWDTESKVSHCEPLTYIIPTILLYSVSYRAPSKVFWMSNMSLFTTILRFPFSESWLSDLPGHRCDLLAVLSHRHLLVSCSNPAKHKMMAQSNNSLSESMYLCKYCKVGPKRLLSPISNIFERRPMGNIVILQKISKTITKK